jgi:hypothetical protein
MLGATLQSLVKQVTWHLGSEQLRNREKSSSSKLLRCMNLITSCWWYGAIRQVSSNKALSFTGHPSGDSKNFRVLNSSVSLERWWYWQTSIINHWEEWKPSLLKNVMKLSAEYLANSKAWVTHRLFLLTIWMTYMPKWIPKTKISLFYGPVCCSLAGQKLPKNRKIVIFFSRTVLPMSNHLTRE